MTPVPQNRVLLFAEMAIKAGWEWCGYQEAIPPALPVLVIQRWGVVKRIPFNPSDFDPIAVATLTFKPEEKKMKLKEKLYEIYKAIDLIEKRGKNAGQHYDYVKAADVTREIREQLIQQRVYAEINFDFVGGPFNIARAREKDAPFSAVMVKCSVRFHDLDSDDVLTGSGLGTGADAGDKSAYKAQTGAMKYALKNACLVPDEAGADPEADPTMDENNNSVQAAEIPDFQDAKRGAAPQGRPASRPTQAAPKQAEENPFDSQPSAASSTKSQASPAPAPIVAAPSTTSAAPDAAPEPGDAYEGPDPVDDRLPTEDELNEYRKLYSTFSKDIAAKGKITASKGLTAPKKLTAFLLYITKAKALKDVTKAQWDDFFARVEKATAKENGFVDLVKLINKVNGIEEKQK